MFYYISVFTISLSLKRISWIKKITFFNISLFTFSFISTLRASISSYEVHTFNAIIDISWKSWKKRRNTSKNLDFAEISGTQFKRSKLYQMPTDTTSMPTTQLKKLNNLSHPNYMNVDSPSSTNRFQLVYHLKQSRH